ncbi:Cytochrome c oxidase subunit CcoQ [hydrothermal vent metagenome]|uniref:Cytochrome c oxidase subunit CcoQ n=1 Tax=hydrothermal vent metagenome TaxID=652676 RepID=A0A1W1C364_9ZZZZ
MDINTFSAYAYFFLILFLVIVLYSYIYHLYTKRKSADGVDYEEYANMALDDDLDSTPVKSKSDEKEK